MLDRNRCTFEFKTEIFNRWWLGKKKFMIFKVMFKIHFRPFLVI